MPWPMWVHEGVVVQNQEGPLRQGYIASIGDNRLTVGLINDPSDEAVHVELQELLDRVWIPDRWIRTIEALHPPYAFRATYKDDRIWEVRTGEPILPWMIDRGSELMSRVSGNQPAIYTVQRRQSRRGIFTVEGPFAGQIGVRDLTVGEIQRDYLPVPPYEVGHQVCPAGTFRCTSDAYTIIDIDPHTRDVRIVDHADRVSSLPLALLVANYDLYSRPDRVYTVPEWVRVGAVLRNLSTNEEFRVSQIDFGTSHVHMWQRVLSMGEVYHTWVPENSDLAREDRAIRNRVGSYWGFVNPPALVQIESENDPDLGAHNREYGLRIIGSSVHETMHEDQLLSRSIRQTGTLSIPLVPEELRDEENDGLRAISSAHTWPIGSLLHAVDGRFFYVATRDEGGTLLVSDFALDYSIIIGAEASTTEAPHSLSVQFERNRRARRLIDEAEVASIEDDDLTVGSFYLWEDPPALLEIVGSVPHTTVDVRLVPGTAIETVPRAVFDLRSVELTFRNHVDAFLGDLQPGYILDVPEPVAVGESEDGRLVLYSTAALEGTDGVIYSNARTKGSIPTTLGYARRELPAIITSPRNSGDPTTPQAPPPEVKIGQLWEIDGVVVCVDRIGLEHSLAWVSAINADEVSKLPQSGGYGIARLQRDGRLWEGSTSVEGEQWVRLTSRQSLTVLDYDAKARAAHVRWQAGSREEEIKVVDLLRDFVCITSGGRARALEIHNAPGAPAWARLRLLPGQKPCHRSRWI